MHALLFSTKKRSDTRRDETVDEQASRDQTTSCIGISTFNDINDERDTFDPHAP